MADTIPWSKGDPEMLFAKTAILDEGAFGTVWRGNLRRGNQAEVAIKLMPFTEEVLDELRSEVNFLKGFDSEFVIHYYGTWLNKRNDDIWIVMELAELGSIEGIMIFCEYNFSESQLAALFARILLGIDYVHSKGLVHQDIKAKNILLTRRGEVKLADFGVAASVTNVNNNSGTVSGSPHWMAPEILSGSEITQKCDIWSCGITMLELAEGAPPLADIPPINVISVIPERQAPTFQVPSRWSKSAKAFLARMCEKDPEKRRTAARLMKHPFVKDEVAKATAGEHDILQDLADECYETIQEARQFDEEEGEESMTVIEEEYSSEYETSSDGEMMIINSKQPKWKQTKREKTQSSFASVVVDESKLEAESVQKKKSRRKKPRRTRMTRVKKKSVSMYSKAKPRVAAKQSLLKKKNLELNMNEVKAIGGDTETKKKAEDLLQKIMGLTNRKQL